jgi:hypothetical protein
MAIAIVFSFLLLLPQSFFVSGAVAQAATVERSQCACDTHRCCVNKSAPESSSLPLAPARSGNSSDSFWLQAWAAMSFILPAAPASALSSSSSCTPTLDRVPLYQRNCAYLL